MSELFAPQIGFVVVLTGSLVVACAGTDGISIGPAPDASASTDAPSMEPQHEPPLPEPQVMSEPEDAGADDFTTPVTPVQAPGSPPPPNLTNPLNVLREACVNTINQYRAAVGSPPLRRWTAAEACVDAQATVDAYYLTSHRTFRQCTELAQNECPNWPGATGAQAIGSCLQAMWNARPNGSHFRNMVSTRWTHVACGIAQASNGRWWLVQNYR